MTDATVFLLALGHLGRDRFGTTYLHARVSATLDRICADVPGSFFDVRDRSDNGIGVPQRPDAFAGPVEDYDVLGDPKAPNKVVVFAHDAAARLGAAFPDMPRRPHDGIAFALEGAHLSRDRFGSVYLSPEVARAIGACVGGGGPGLWHKVVDGEGLPAVSNAFSELGAGFSADREVAALNGFEPRYVVFHDRGAAEKFGRLFPAMRRERLGELERVWRAARVP